MEFEYDYHGMGRWLRGPESVAVTRAVGVRAKGIYQSVVAHRTGTLARSASVGMTRGMHGRPVAVLSVGLGTDYGLAHEYGADDGDMNIQAANHDLLTVLGMLQ